jgi:hypothetical protein
MRRRSLFAAVVAIGGALALPASVAAQTPTQDSVRATISNNFLGGRVVVSAQSGPSGENPSGTVEFFGRSGPVTCLEVSGNTAYVATLNPLFSDLTFKFVDGGPPGSGLDRADGFFSNLLSSANCAYFPPEQPPRNPVTNQSVEGDIVVVDATPLPTSKEQCKNGGWKSYGTTFKNQGQCVAFVERGPKP